MGGAAALGIAVLLGCELIAFALFPRPSTVAEHFALFSENWLVGLLTLDLLGMVAYLLFIPMILALYVTLRESGEAATLVSTVLFFLGVADFFATNTAFPVLTLSRQYLTATSEADRAIYLAAGQAMFTLFNENAFLVSYVLVSGSWVMISGVMLRSKVFGRSAAISGMLAGGTGIAAVILEHVPAGKTMFDLSIALYFAALVFLLAWVILTGRRLLRLDASRST